MNAKKITKIQYVSRINSLFILYENSAVLKIFSLLESKPKLELEFSSRLEERYHFNQILTFDFHEKNSLLCLSVDTKLIVVFKLDFGVLDSFKTANFGENENCEKISSLTSPEMTNLKFSRVLNLFPLILYSQEPLLPILALNSLDSLVALSPSNEIYCFHSINDEMAKTIGNRKRLRKFKIAKKWRMLYTESLCEVEMYKWCCISTFESTVIFFDPESLEVTFRMRLSLLAHSIHNLPGTSSLVTVFYEKEWCIYEISKYFKEQQIFNKMFGHIGIIQASTLIRELSILITGDYLGVVRSWDLQTKKCIQSSKIKSSSLNIYKIVPLGSVGFIVFTSELHFFKFEDDSNQYVNADKLREDNYSQSLEKNEKRTEKQFVVIPQIQTEKSKTGVTQFYVSTSEETRSFNLDNGMLSWRYSSSKFNISVKRRSVACFLPVSGENSGVFFGMSDGNIVFVREKSENSTILKVMLEKVRKKIVVFGRNGLEIRMKGGKSSKNRGKEADSSILGFKRSKKSDYLLCFTSTKLVVLNSNFEKEPSSLRRLEILSGGEKSFIQGISGEIMTISEVYFSKNETFLIVKLTDLAILVVKFDTFECIFAKIDTNLPLTSVYSDEKRQNLLAKNVNFVSNLANLKEHDLVLANYDSKQLKFFYVDPEIGYLKEVFCLELFS